MERRRFRIACVHCLRPILTVEHLHDLDLTQLRVHVSQHHPGKTPPARLPEAMRHFRIESEPEPPDAA